MTATKTPAAQRRPAFELVGEVKVPDDPYRVDYHFRERRTTKRLHVVIAVESRPIAGGQSVVWTVLVTRETHPNGGVATFERLGKYVYGPGARVRNAPPTTKIAAALAREVDA